MRFISLPFIKTAIKNFDKDISSLGIQKAMKKLLKRTHTQLEIIKSKQIDKILKNHPVILIANHPHEIEPIPLFAATPSRKKTFIIANYQWLNVINNLDKHIIPVFIKHNQKKDSPGSIRVKTLDFLCPPLKMAYKTAHQKNIKSITLASQKISQNSLLIIFPFNSNNHWFSGVGHLLKGVKCKKPIYLAKAYIENTCRLDVFRLFPIINLFFPKIKITFAKPWQVNHLQKFNGKTITKKIEKNYKAWQKTLN